MANAHPSPRARLFPDLAPWTLPGAPAVQCDQARLLALDAWAQDFAERPGAYEDADNPDLPAGYTYLGQLLNHDLGFITPRLDLAAVYGTPQAPAAMDPARTGADGFMGHFAIGASEDGADADLPRTPAGTARIPDQRNDETLMLSQLHLTLLRLHNHALEAIPGAPATAFAGARRVVTWFYQYLIWNDLVRRLADPHMFAAATQGHAPRRPRHFRAGRNAFLPLEFASGSYRFGHALARGGYFLNYRMQRGNRNPTRLFDAAAPDHDLRGGRPLPAGRWVQWDWFFEAGGTAQGLQFARPIQPAYTRRLAQLQPRLAARDVLAAWKAGLPSGQTLAAHLGLTPLPNAANPIDDCLPIYVLRESAHSAAAGRHLGPVGSALLLETIGGLLHADPASYVHAQLPWTPRAERTLGRHRSRLAAGWSAIDLMIAAGIAIN